MIRTRDYVLFLLAVFFLFIGISATVVQDLAPALGQTAAVFGTYAEQPDEALSLEAELVEANSLDRAGRLALMREKVAERIKSVVAKAPEVEEPAESPSESPKPAEEGLEGGTTILTCASFATLPIKNYTGAQFKEVEGARIVYRPGAPVVTAATGTVPVEEETTLLQLPLRTMPLPTPSCIPHDVVGIALDGSQIRNDEVALYSVFGSETLVGYALDGFPIYGRTASVKTDRCGGTTVGGMYRYYLGSDRETILNCFAGAPITL